VSRKSQVISILVPCMVAFVGLTHSASAQIAGQPFALTITMNKDSTSTESRKSLIVNVTLTNTSAKDIGLEKSATPEHEYIIDIVDQNGEDVPLKESQVSSGAGFDIESAIFMIKLAPQEALHEHIKISDIYDLTKPGTYSITLRRSVLSPDANIPDDYLIPAKDIVSSNIVKVNVTE
jgi:hypothetical protein